MLMISKKSVSNAFFDIDLHGFQLRKYSAIINKKKRFKSRTKGPKCKNAKPFKSKMTE